MYFGSLFIGFSIILINTNVESFEIINDVVSAAFYTSYGVNDTRDLRIPNNINTLGTFLETDEQIRMWGYESERHTVTTKDGYVIHIFRVFGGPKASNNANKPAVYVQHGLLASSDSWVLFGPGNDIVFLLVDLGYDVWLGNFRGNFYGKYNNNYNTTNKEFWHWSYHEIAVIDLPTIIDHVLETTGQSKLTYIGHSLGTTISYVLLSEKPEYNEKFNLVISFAPISYWKVGPGEFWELLATMSPLYLYPLKFAGIYSVLSRSTFSSLINNFCQNDSIFRNICVLIIYLAFGKDPVNLDHRYLSYLGLYNPAGISTQTIVHFQQNIRSGNFEQFDYASPNQQYYHLGDNNRDVYGTDKPPKYNLTKISAPFALYYSRQDALAKPKNAEVLASHLPNVVVMESVQTEPFNHLDFMWATNVKEVLYDRVIKLISEYSM